MELKNFNDFLNESAPGPDKVAAWKSHFLETIVNDLEDHGDAFMPSVNYDSVKLDEVHNAITIDTRNVIDDNKEYSVLDISRPTINLDYRVVLRFIFDDNKIRAYISPAAKYGLTEAKFEDLFKLEVSSTLEVTVEELEDFFHTEGDENLSEIDIDKDFKTVEEFSVDFYMQVDHWMEELYRPMYGKDPLRSWLDDYEKKNDKDEDDDY